MTLLVYPLCAILIFLVLNYWRVYKAYKASILACNNAVSASNAAKSAYEKAVNAMEKQVDSKNELIKAITEEYESVAKRAIQLRLTLMQMDMPQFRSSARVSNAIEELKRKYTSKEIDVFAYYSSVNRTLDLVSTKNYN